MSLCVIVYSDQCFFMGADSRLSDKINGEQYAINDHTYKIKNIHTLYGYAQAANGDYYPAGSGTITTLAIRPSNFSWTYAKTSGGNFNLTAAEWNSFTSSINLFRVYKNLGNYTFTSAVSGNNFTATIFNQARKRIE